MGRAKRIAKWLKKKLPTSCLSRERSSHSDIPSVPAPEESRLPALVRTRAAFNTAYIIYTGRVDAVVEKPSKLFSQRNGISRKNAQHKQELAENNRRDSLQAVQERLRLRNKLAQEARRRRSIVSTRSLSHGYSLLEEVSFFSLSSHWINSSEFGSVRYIIRTHTSQIFPPSPSKNVEQMTKTNLLDKLLQGSNTFNYYENSDGKQSILYYTKYAPALGGIKFHLMSNVNNIANPPKCLRVKAKPQQEKWKIELQAKMEKALNNRELHITERKKKLRESFLTIEKARESKKLECIKKPGHIDQGKVDQPDGGASGHLDYGQDKVPTDVPHDDLSYMPTHDQQHEIVHLAGREEMSFSHESASTENCLISRMTMTDSYLFELSASDDTMTTPIGGESSSMLGSSNTMSDIHSTNYESASTSAMSSGSDGRKLTPSMLHVKCSDLYFATGEQSPSQWNISESFQNQCASFHSMHHSAAFEYTEEDNADISEDMREEDQLSATHNESSITSRNADDDNSDTDECNNENSDASNKSQTILHPITTTAGHENKAEIKKSVGRRHSRLTSVTKYLKHDHPKHSLLTKAQAKDTTPPRVSHPKHGINTNEKPFPKNSADQKHAKSTSHIPSGTARKKDALPSIKSHPHQQRDSRATPHTKGGTQHAQNDTSLPPLLGAHKRRSTIEESMARLPTPFPSSMMPSSSKGNKPFLLSGSQSEVAGRDAKLGVSAKKEDRKLSTSLPPINRSGSLISQRLDPVLSMTRLDQENSDDPNKF